MDFILYLTIQSIEKVWLTLQHNWPFLFVSVVIAALLKLYLSADKVSEFLKRYSGAGVRPPRLHPLPHPYAHAAPRLWF